MKKTILPLLICLLGVCGAKADDVETIKRNYKQLLLSENKGERDLIEILTTQPKEAFYSDQMVVELMDRYPIQPAEVASLLSTFRPDGTWSDIDYADTNRSGWRPKKHAERILFLAKAYNLPNSGYYQSPEIENILHEALQYWFDAKLVSPNWWYNQISIPKTMGAIIVLMEDQLTADEKAHMLKYMENSKFGMTGQNKVWLAGNVLVRSLMQNDLDMVKSARDTIFSEIRIADKEGIRPDNSFHQHGSQLQFGNYGAAFAATMGLWTQVLNGTAMAVDADQLDILNRLINQGYRRVLWKGYMDVNSLGRQFFHQAQRHKALSVGFSSAMLMDADKANASRYRTLLNENFYTPEVDADMTGLYHYWMSDMTVQRRPRWMASVRMSSPRVIGAESLNGDNLKGYYLADGAMYTYVDGDEYDNIFAVWDWRKLPGVTAYETDAPLKQLKSTGYHNQSTFVGNVNNGSTGMTAMQLDRDGLRASKAWIFTDDFVLCLGAGITADSGLVVTTAIDQRIQKAPLKELKGNRWVKTTSVDFGNARDMRFYHDKTGYIVLNADSGKATTEHRTGAWTEIMSTYPADFTESKDVFSLWLDHGKDPQGASYAYLVLPDQTEEQVKKFDLNRIKVLSNTPRLQSVQIGNTVYVALYPLADMNQLEGVRFHSTNTGLFMFEDEPTRTKVTVVDPTQLQTQMDISFKGKTQTIQLPSGDEKGTPVVVYFDK